MLGTRDYSDSGNEDVTICSVGHLTISDYRDQKYDYKNVVPFEFYVCELKVLICYQPATICNVKFTTWP